MESNFIRKQGIDKIRTKFPINQLEQLAVIKGYRYNFFVAYGHPTTILCDNKPSVANAKQLETRMMGKMLALVNNTGAKVSYRKGNEHQVADFFSRFKALLIAEISKEFPRYYMEDIENDNGETKKFKE